MLIPIFQSLSKEMSDKVYFAKVDIDRSLDNIQKWKRSRKNSGFYTKRPNKIKNKSSFIRARLW